MIRVQWFVCAGGVIHVRKVYVVMWEGMLVVLSPSALQQAMADLN